jgi:putative salt-induced outer membrane protein YdiY
VVLFFRPLPLFLILLAAAWLVPAGWARDELRFANGDRISGKVVSQENGKIRFVSETLGELEIRAEGVEVAIDVPDTPVEALAGLPPAPTPTPPPAATPATPPEQPAQVRPAPPASVKPAALAQAAQNWKGKVEAGFVQHSGRTNRVDISLRAEAERQFGKRNRLRADSRILYAESGTITTNDRYDASLRWRRDITERMFGQTHTSGYRDKVKLIDINAEQNVGLGYKLIDRKNHVLNLGSGMTAQYRESPRSPDGWAYLIEGFQDYTWRINGRITFTQNATAFYSPPELSARNAAATVPGAAGVGNYRIRFNSTLQGRVTERISMNLRYEFEHDATILNPNLRDDKRITSSIGYAF